MNKNILISIIFVLVLFIGIGEGYYLHEAINHYNTQKEAIKIIKEKNDIPKNISNSSIIKLNCTSDLNGRK